MSRYHTKIKGTGVDVFYGFDNAVGYFYEEWEDEDAPKRDLDSLLGGLSRGYLLELLNQTDAPEEHKRSIALDRPF